MTHVLTTLSSEEAASALGVRPSTIRNLIKNGRLAAVRIGRSWRIYVDSINALLGAPAPTSAAPVASSPAEHASASKPSPSATPSAQGIPAIASPDLPIFTRDDDPQIQRCRDMLVSSNDNVRLVARWILDKHARFGGSVATPAPPVSRYKAADFANLF